MTRLRGTPAAAVAVALFLLAACARPAASPGAAPEDSGASSAPPPAAADEVVLRVRHEGGFVPVDMIPGRIPLVSVYGDGRVITQGPQIAVYPGPALPNVQVQQLDPARLDDLLQRAMAAGVRSGADYGVPGVADAPATRVEVRYAGRTYAVTVEALGEAQQDDPRLTPEQQAARAKLSAFVNELTALPTAAGMPEAAPYRPAAVAALARAYTPPGDELPVKPAPVAWPGPALPGPELFPRVGLGCVTATGAQAEAVLAAAAKATAITPWTSAGKRYTVTFRPMLPEESGCADLKGAK
jgi:hypothetical protein